MAKSAPLINNFNAGELDPRVLLRSDQQKYFAGCKTLENCVPLLQGGAMAMPGTYFVIASADQSHRSRMVPFTYSTVQAYMLEFSEHVIRVFKDGGIVVDGSSDPVEIVTTYDEEELRELIFRQTADTLWVWHSGHPTATLTRSSHTDWVLSDAVFSPPPSYEAPTYLDATLTPVAKTGANIQFDAGAAVFLAADKGRQIISGVGRAIIITVDTTSQVHVDIRVDFADTSAIASGDWYLDGSPITDCTPDRVKVKEICTLTLVAAGWRAEDVGKYVKIHGGMVKITLFKTTVAVDTEVLSELSATTATPSWTLESESWSATRGYPTCGHFYDGCLWAGGTLAQPTTAWKSRSADFTSFVMGSADDDAAIFTLVSGKMDRILWIAGDDVIVIGTAEGVWKPQESSTGEPISATSPPSFRKTISLGVKALDPIQAVDSLLWVSKTGMTVRRMAYDLAADRYSGRNLTRMAGHITKGSTQALSGIVETAFQQEPIPIYWGVRADGQLLGMVFSPEEDVYAWFRLKTRTGDTLESAGVLTQEDEEDQVWIQTLRSVNGSPARYIEYFKPHDFFGQIADAFFVHCGLSYTASGGETTLTGLTHLEDEEVKIVVEGEEIDAQTVASGVVALENGGVTVTLTAGDKAHVGLSYIPVIEPTNPIIGNQTGSNRGMKQKIHKVTVAMYETGEGVKIGRDATHLVTVPELEPGELTTDDREVVIAGDWTRKATLRIEQTKPLPMTILGMVPRLTVNPD
jgi:hypothetical protein